MSSLFFELPPLLTTLSSGDNFGTFLCFPPVSTAVDGESQVFRFKRVRPSLYTSLA